MSYWWGWVGVGWGGGGWGVEMAYIGLLFTDTGFPVPDIGMAIITSYGIINVWDTVSAHIQIPRMFLSTDFLFKQRTGYVTIDNRYMRFIL